MIGEKAAALIASEPRRINILHGSVRSGKTTNLLLLAPKRILHDAPKKGEIIITGRTAETAYRNVIKPLQDMFGTSRVGYSRGTHEGSFGSRTFFVFGANDETASDKIQGMTGAYWMADEASLYPESFIKMGLSRLSPAGSFADWTMNPQSPHHFIKKDFIDREHDLDAKVWHFILEDNPNLPPSYVENLKKEYQVGSLYYKRFVSGLWVMAEGAIYDFFNESQHCISSLPKADWKFATCDYGTSNATSVGLCGVSNKPTEGQPRVWLEREYYHSGRDTGQTKTDAQYAAEIKAWLEGENIREFILDPSAASFRAALENVGIPVRDADNDVLNGIRTVSSMLHIGQFKIGTECKQTVKGISGYMWDSKAQARGEDKPLKINDHTCDMVRYGLFTLFGQNVARVTTSAGRM
jgi:PBSX family phage terminase large subunit